ncbi:MAG: hypothetical protein MPF33_08285 [Candidatus Aramenus sp.]|nr:hypothetical protein [Candidatus Aramenus sp.]
MKILRFSIKGGELIHDENGNVIGVIDEGFVKLTTEDGIEIDPRSVKPKLDREDLDLVSMINRIKEVDLLDALLLKKRERRMRLIKTLGQVFEEFVLGELSREFKVEVHPRLFLSLGKFSSKRQHNTPDFLVEGKVIVEAKVGKVDYAQIEEYSRFYPGVVALPYSDSCIVPKGWQCVNNVVLDPKRLLDKVRIYLDK